MEKRERELRRLINAECAKVGAKPCSLKRNGGSHYHASIRTADGRALMLIFPYSPSDARSLANMKALLRRQLNAHQ
jgi:hypothetical protein